MTNALKAVLVSVTALLLVGLGGPAAKAEGAHFDVGVFAGMMTFDGVVNADNGPVFGVRAGFDWSHKWGVEFIAAGQKSEMEDDPSRDRDHAIAVATLQYSFRFDGDQIAVPYIGVGAGGWREYTTRAPDQNEPVVHGVVGLRLRATENVSIMLDIREWYVPHYNPYRRKNVGANCESAQIHVAYRF